MNWQQQPMVNNGSCALLALQCFFKRVSRSEVFLPGCQWKVLVFRSVSVHCESPHIQEQLLGKTWCPCLLNLYQFSALRRFYSIHSWMSFQMFPYWQKECFASQWEIDLCVCVCVFVLLIIIFQDIDWVQTEKHVFEQASNHPFLVGLHSCFQTESRSVHTHSFYASIQV